MRRQGQEPLADGDEVALALYSLAATVVRHMPRDLSLTAVATLYALERRGPQRITQLAALEGVTQPSMTALATKLEHLGLAERSCDPTDGRAVRVSLSVAGVRYVNDRRRTGAQGLGRLIDDLPDDEAGSLRAALPALRTLVALGQLDIDAPRWLTSAPGGAPQ